MSFSSGGPREAQRLRDHRLLRRRHSWAFQQQPQTFAAIDNPSKQIELNMQVDFISFSAHSDYEQTLDFVKQIKTNHVVLVHGDKQHEPHAGAHDGRHEGAERNRGKEGKNTVQVYTPGNDPDGL